MSRVSPTPTPWAIICSGFEEDKSDACGQVFLTEEEYHNQLSRPDATWRCPRCGVYPAMWDDENYENFGPKKRKK